MYFSHLKIIFAGLSAGISGASTGEGARECITWIGDNNTAPCAGSFGAQEVWKYATGSSRHTDGLPSMDSKVEYKKFRI